MWQLQGINKVSTLMKNENYIMKKNYYMKTLKKFLTLWIISHHIKVLMHAHTEPYINICVYVPGCILNLKINNEAKST